MRDRDAIIERLLALFIERFHVEVPAPDTDLLETGILDSLQLVDLLLQLGQDFGFSIAIETLELDDLRTLDGLAGVLAAHGSPITAVTVAAQAAPPPAGVAAGKTTESGPAEVGTQPQGRAKARLTLVSSPRNAIKPPISVRGGG